MQAHLVTVYEAERNFTRSVAFADSFPFPATSVNADLLAEYWKQRNALRDLYTDEATQLTALVQAIRTKKYEESEKRQLYLLLLGYVDVLASVVQLLETHLPVHPPKDEELTETKLRFNRLRDFIRLNIKGMPNLLKT